MSITVAELRAIITADDSEFQRAADRVEVRLRSLGRLAEEIKRMVPGTADEVDSVLSEIERLARIKVESG